MCKIKNSNQNNIYLWMIIWYKFKGNTILIFDINIWINSKALKISVHNIYINSKASKYLHLLVTLRIIKTCKNHYNLVLLYQLFVSFSFSGTNFICTKIYKQIYGHGFNTALVEIVLPDGYTYFLNDQRKDHLKPNP